MIFRNLFIVLAVLTLILFIGIDFKVYAQGKSSQGGQQMSDFSLSGFAQKGKKSWDLTGKQADIANEVIKLNDIESNLYGEKENMKLTSPYGDFDRLKGILHLENNVVVTTSSGAKLTTNSLDWDRKKELVTTPDMVNILKDGLIINGQGARANLEFNKMNLEKDVKVQINNPVFGGETKKEKIEITCDGPLEVDYQKNFAVFQNKVKVVIQDGVIESEVMEVYFSPNKNNKKDFQDTRAVDLGGSNIDKIVARGNVKITRGQNVSFSEQAVYSAQERKISLIGKPKLIVYGAK